jgi:hypothetical protein
MNPPRWISPLFYFAAAYDGILGLVFLLAPDQAFEMGGVTPPLHMGYVHFPAALLIIFALMFTAIARNPGGNRNLIAYGVLLKVAYCGVVGWHWLSAGIPFMWKPFVVADIIMAALFVWAQMRLSGARSQAAD